MRTFISVFLIVICAGINAQKVKSYSSHWHDYKNDDFQSYPADFIYSEKGKFYYFISNEKDNIYINLKIFDRGVQNQIRRSGLTIWVNMDGKKAKKTGILYPVPDRPYRGPGSPGMENNPGNNRISKEGIDRQAGKANSLKLIGFSIADQIITSSQGNDTFRGSVRDGNDEKLWYEVIIPVSKLKVVKDKNGDGIKPFVLGFEYESPSSYTRGGRSGGREGMSSGGYGCRPGGGGAGGGRSGGGRSGRGSMGGGPEGGMRSAPAYDSVSYVIFWIRNIRLAAEK